MTRSINLRLEEASFNKFERQKKKFKFKTWESYFMSLFLITERRDKKKNAGI